ncbi:serine protease HTRA2, mitochondrial-like [Planococcus citri]|uniref:serine protease HTRA2, mitochondrial-like n=1 Tax=Planococcus citri TaxID=170843 RepID=UPI0031F8D831
MAARLWFLSTSCWKRVHAHRERFSTKLHFVKSRRFDVDSQRRHCGTQHDYGDGDSGNRKTRFYATNQLRKVARNGLTWCGAIGIGIGIGGYYLYKNEIIRVNASTSASASIWPVASAASLSKRNLRDQFNFIADIVAECADAVVCVDIKDTRRLDYFSRSHPSMTNGSGFIVEENGLILTNAHVVMGHPRSAVQIRLADGTVYPGIVEDIDVKSDLATIRVKPKAKLPVMKLGVSKDLRPGEWVIAMGSPLSLSNTITAGVVSSVSRTSTELGLFDKDMDYIQTDASITFGNSGGPLVNLDGQVVGINSMKVSAGISFAIPIDCARQFLKRGEARRSKGIITPPSKRYLGITMLTLNADTLRALQIRNHHVPAEITRGALVWKVVIGSPAYRGGLVPGDIVVEINGLPVESSNAVYQALEKHNVLNVRIYRDNAYFDLVIQPEDVSFNEQR